MSGPTLRAHPWEQGANFRLPIYEGPLDLLLHLLKRAELDPQDVTASVITEQYLQYLELLDSLNLDVAGEYLVMAATLLLIKSFSLLPEPEVANVEEADDLKRELVERLLEYQRYREAAEKLAARPLVGRDVFTAPGELPRDHEGEPVSYEVSLFDLVEAIGRVLRRLDERRPRELTLGEIAVEQCIPRIVSALRERRRVRFIELFETVEDRALVIATFIALLELMRRANVRAYQQERFGEIWLEPGESFAAASGEGA